MNNAPFHVGQNVVCVKTHSWGLVVEERMYTVTGVGCCLCGLWWVSVGVTNPLFFGMKCDCNIIIPHNLDVKFGSNLFAPITPRSVSIPESLKEQAEEMISVRETIKEPKKELA